MSEIAPISSRLPPVTTDLDEDERIIEEVQRRKQRRKAELREQEELERDDRRARGRDFEEDRDRLVPYDRKGKGRDLALVEDEETSSTASSEYWDERERARARQREREREEEWRLRGRRRERTPEGPVFRYRSRSPSPVPVTLHGKEDQYRRTGASPPPMASQLAQPRVRSASETSLGLGPVDPRTRELAQLGYNVVLPTGGPYDRKSMTTPKTRLEEEEKPALVGGGLRRFFGPRVQHMAHTHPLGVKTLDLETRIAKYGAKHGEMHFITFGKLEVRLIRGKSLPKNGTHSVFFYLPTPSMDDHGPALYVSKEAKRVENYTWDETFTTPVELETIEMPATVHRNLAVRLHYTSPHLHRNLGDMEGTVDVSDMIRSSMPLHAEVALPLYPVGGHKHRQVDDKFRPKIYLEVLWRPSEAFRHSHKQLLDQTAPNFRGLKSRTYRLNVSGFAPYGTSFGLVWLEHVAQSWVYNMDRAINVTNITGSVQPGPFDNRGRSPIWEAIVSVWYQVNKRELKYLAEKEYDPLLEKQLGHSPGLMAREAVKKPVLSPDVEAQNAQQSLDDQVRARGGRGY